MDRERLGADGQPAAADGGAAAMVVDHPWRQESDSGGVRRDDWTARDVRDLAMLAYVRTVYKLGRGKTGT
jgi:hypothetical protein